MVAIIGRKHSGKTTLVVRLAAELHRRGHRVMTIKHGAHTFNIDPASTDTYRHYHEGRAERVAMVAPDKFALVMRWSEEQGPEEIATRHMADADIVLCEGFKSSALPKIEIHRRDAHAAPLLGTPAVDAATYCAMVTDDDSAPPGVPLIRLGGDGWLEAVADIVERDIMRRAQQPGGLGRERGDRQR
jgi:molybdopterin-guanine dinucleotide biosynthesis adapter protein